MDKNEYHKLSIEEAKEYIRLWRLYSKMLPNAKDNTIAQFVSIAVDTCCSCYSHPRGCQCWNDV